MLGGGIAFAALTLAAAGYTAMRLHRDRPGRNARGLGRAQGREQILLADFENRAADSTLGPSVTEAFRVDLSQSPTVRVMDQQAVSQALTRMQRPAGGTLPVALARELAEREGIKAVVTGQIDPVGQGYVLAASLISTADGRDAERGARNRRGLGRAAQGDRPAVRESCASGSGSRSRPSGPTPRSTR